VMVKFRPDRDGVQPLEINGGSKNGR
jgi:hypothetical protein